MRAVERFPVWVRAIAVVGTIAVVVGLALLSPGEVAAWPLVAAGIAALIAFAAVAWARRS